MKYFCVLLSLLLVYVTWTSFTKVNDLEDRYNRESALSKNQIDTLTVENAKLKRTINKFTQQAEKKQSIEIAAVKNRDFYVKNSLWGRVYGVAPPYAEDLEGISLHKNDQ